MSHPREERRRKRREDRLEKEAERQGRSSDEVRVQLVDGGLDRLDQERVLQADVLLVTVTETETTELVQAAEGETGHKVTRQRGKAGRYRILGDIGKQRVLAIRLREQGSYSPQGSAFTCYAALAETGATTLTGVGTAFAVNTIQQQIGDVLVSTSLVLYEEARIRDGTVETPDRADSPAAPCWLAERLRILGLTRRTVPEEEATPYEYHYDERARVRASSVWVKRLREVQRVQPETVSFHFGTLLAGGAHIESEVFRDELVRRVERVPSDYDPVVGGEMEAAGLAAACEQSGADWLVVKGVSDFATAASRAQIEANRITAARNAARSALHALSLDPSMA